MFISGGCINNSSASDSTRLAAMSEPWTPSQRNELAALCGGAGLAFSHPNGEKWMDGRGYWIPFQRVP